MNRSISLISLLGTIVFLMLTTVLGFVIHSVGDPNKPIFWLFTTLFVGMFLSLMLCLSNLRTAIQIGKDKLESIEDEVNLTTCPDYWIKNVVYDDESKSKTILCYNMMNDGTFIDGEMLKDSAGVYTFSNTRFAGSNITDMRNLAISENSNVEAEVVENFTQFYPGDTDYQKYLHSHATIDKIVHGPIYVNTPAIGNVNLEHEHIYENTGSGSHSHTLDFEGGIYQQKNYVETLSNLTNWISPYNNPEILGNKYAIEINLNVLNLQDNTCELAKMFTWSEAHNKCMN